jgi:hypothetical protein
METEIASFFQQFCPEWAPKAKKLFDDAVELRTKVLLMANAGYSDVDFKTVSDSNLFQTEPKFTLEASLLFNRAVRARLPGLSERKIDVKKILLERVRKEKIIPRRRII